MSPSDRSSLPDRDVIDNVLHSVVQIVALRQGFLGGMSPAWTGSGTVVHPDGIILTNCHVANPRAMGMPAPPADKLGIAISQRSDEPPALTYFADIIAQVPELDLAVLRIEAGLDGRPVGDLDLPFVPVGDSDTLELGDQLAIFGYPGIGGETVTFTSGAVSGFTSQKGLRDRRAWIKTDATIAGGNSGGTGVDHAGRLVGVPTQAAAGTGITPVDARPVVDTNRDGRVDQRDTPMAIGGFINGLRPVNLAGPLLAKAGLKPGAVPARAKRSTKSTKRTTKSAAAKKAVRGGTGSRSKAKAPVLSTLLFSTRVTRDGRPINPAAILPDGGKEIFATFDYDGLKDGMRWTQVWAVNNRKIMERDDKWDDGTRGRKVLRLSNPKGLPDGQYHLVLAVDGKVLAEGKVVKGRRVEDTDTQVSGQIVDEQTGKGVPDALVVALKPGVPVKDFAKQQKREMAFTSARTGRDGRFEFPQQLPKGHAYGLVVASKDHRDLLVDGALRISAHAPENAQLSPIPMRRG